MGKILRLGLEKGWHFMTTSRLFIGVVFFLIISLVLSLDFLSPLETLEIGQVSPKNIKAPISKDIIDEEKTRLAREQKVRSTAPVYTHDPNVIERVKREDAYFYKVILNYQIEYPDSGAVGKDSEPWQRLKAEVGVAVPEAALQKLVVMRPETLAVLQVETDNLVTDILSLPGLTEELRDFPEGMAETRAAGRVLPYSLKEARGIVLERVGSLKLSPEAKEILQVVVPFFLKPNANLDEEATKRLQNEVRQSVTPFTIPLRQGEVIVREGEVVTADHVRILTQLGVLRTGASWFKPLGMSLLVLLNLLVLMWYLRIYRRDLYYDKRMLWLLGLVVALSLVTARVIASIQLHEQPDVMVELLYVIPAATGPMLLAILLDSRVAIFVAIIVSLMVGIIADYSIPHAIVTLLGSLAGIYSVSRFSQRMDFARAGINVAATNMLAIFALGLVQGTNIGTVATYGLPMGLVNGILSAVFMIGSLPYLESGFKLTTSVKLLELANPNQPLLRQLLLEAPGTYHHSLLVGNLGETAAEMIGADPLLVRVGAYYHDVGKIRRPAFFIENQAQGQNPHDKIAPTLSTLIITAHVKDGVEMSRGAGLPAQVIDIVEQHHGQTLASYFYHRALEADRTESVQEKDFRYEGPKPQTKEAALVMLADTVEAAVRSLSQPTTPGKIEGLVRKLIKDKLHDGQLEESDLTFKDLDRVAQAFCRVLNGTYHTRLEYPEGTPKDLEGRKNP
ncbi:MAG: HDIG domain-containing protein [Heliobacteriaceae bacterium]|nr:HDIG domain-containing protein [Heliobacteriaceae bacterium]